MSDVRRLAQEKAARATEKTHATPRTPPTPRTSPTAPERDFTKVANSIVRDVVGHFTGKSKQLYDYLYLKTRGAVVPTRAIKLTKPALMKGAAIGSERTLLKNINHLKSLGLVKVTYTDGQHGGNEYEVLVPEETELRTPPTPPTPRHARTDVGYVPPSESGVGGVGSTPLESTVSSPPKTSSLRHEKNLDDDAALAGLISVLKDLNRELTGKELSSSEGDRWRELGEVLKAEAKIAAARTTVSSVPAFLAEHLRRRLWKLDKKQARAEGRELPDEAITAAAPGVDASACPDCGGSGWWYPEGEAKGVAKCKHESLRQPSGGQISTPGAT
jgi:hypothetical protein